MIILDEGDNSTFNRLIEERKLVVWLHQDRDDCLTESVGSAPLEVIDDGNTHALCGNSSKSSIEREGLSDPILMKHSQLVSRVHQSIVD